METGNSKENGMETGKSKENGMETGESKENGVKDGVKVSAVLKLSVRWKFPLRRQDDPAVNCLKPAEVESLISTFSAGERERERERGLWLLYIYCI